MPAGGSRFEKGREWIASRAHSLERLQFPSRLRWKLGVHRRMVREAARNAVPAQRKKTERPAVKMAAAVSLIDSILELDRKVPRKQRHTSRRIYDRISSHAALAPPIGYGMAING